MNDAAIREIALDPARSILLQAPAGSGKTTVLAQRFLRLLGEAAEPEELLAITFTRKAAAEMRERVLQALDGELDQAGGTGETWRRLRVAALDNAAARGWSLETLAARLRIQTIDSLNHEIARAMPVLGRFQGSLQVIDDASPLHREAALQTLLSIDSDPQMQRDADVLLERLDNNRQRAAELLAKLLAERTRWLPVLLDQGAGQLAAAVEQNLQRITRDTLRRALGLPDPFIEEGVMLARLSARHRADAGHAHGHWRYWLDDGAALDDTATTLVGWRALVDLLLTGSDATGTLRKAINVSSGFPPGEKGLKARWTRWRDALAEVPGIEERMRELRSLPDPALSPAEHEAIAALARILIRAATELQLVFRQRGRVDHTEVAAIARQALTEEGLPTDQAIRQTLRIRHLLVDEFQDVSPEQVQLIRDLTSGWSGEDSRSLFLVGDPMQSIYLFRNSEVGLFLRAKWLGMGDRPLEFLQLTGNFRSRPALVNWANDAFRNVFPREENLRTSAVTFLASAAARDSGAGPDVTVLPVAGKDIRREGELIAGEIRRRRARHPGQRMAILLRFRRLAAPILEQLSRAGIAARGIDLASLEGRQIVRDLGAIGAALLHAGDRSAWLAVLRAPWCGLLLADLEILCGDDAGGILIERIADAGLRARLSTDGQQRMARCAPLLVEAFARRQSQDLATGIENLWLRLGGPATCDGESRLAAGQFITAIRRLCVDRTDLDASDLQRLAERLHASASPEEAADGENPAVEVLTIHHSKGLEWDVVFVPGLGASPGPEPSPLMRWLELPADDGSQDLLLAVRSIGEPGESDPLGRYIARLQEERRRNESTRLAYVAATRAREELVLVGHARPGEEGKPPRPESRSLLAILWPVLQPHFLRASDTAGPAQQTQATRAIWRRVDAHFDPSAGRAPLPQPPVLPGGAVTAAAQLEFQWVGPAARAAGTVVHSALERLARTGDWSELANAVRRRHYELQLLELGMEEDRANAAAGEIAWQLNRLAADTHARWLFSREHRSAHNELRLTGIVDGVIRDIVIDRTFVDEHGIRWVVDYKTSSHSGGGMEEFLARELDRYRPQLQLYLRLAGRLGREPVKAALYFPWLGVLRELPDQLPSAAMENG